MVEDNKKESRPYVGVVLEIGDIMYFAPFTSPKEKHKKMKNGKDFRKISGGTYGAINFNNMIPVKEEALILIDIEGIEDARYRRLLQNQYVSIKADQDNVLRTAFKLRELVLKEDKSLNQNDLKVKGRCCNFSLLEEKAATYESARW